jgi:DNA topoisomerase-1
MLRRCFTAVRTVSSQKAALASLLRDAHAAARAAQLRYTRPGEPGYTRKRSGSGFAYFDAAGRRVKNATVLARIRALAIPPAWTNVWISQSPHGHVQATGRDARGRKQYRYHERFRATRDAAKFEHILRFGETLPRLRRALARDLALERLEKSKVVAAIVELMQRTCVRVGNDCYAEANGSYGLTTLKDGHARISGHELRFRFKGKGGKVHEVALSDRRLARIVKRCRDVPGQRLFQYQDETGGYQPVTSTDVNDYLRRVTGEPFSAKDFRTWAGTLLAVHVLGQAEPGASQAAAKRQVKSALERVSAQLGNTVAICRKSYVHPAVIDQYSAGRLRSSVQRALKAARQQPIRGLKAPEVVAVHWLRALPAALPGARSALSSAA